MSLSPSSSSPYKTVTLLELGYDLLTKIYGEIFSIGYRDALCRATTYPIKDDLLAAFINKTIFDLAYPMLFCKVVLVIADPCAKTPYKFLTILRDRQDLSARVTCLTYRSRMSPPIQRGLPDMSAANQQALDTLLATELPHLQTLHMLGDRNVFHLLPRTASLTSLVVYVTTATASIIEQVIQRNCHVIQRVALHGPYWDKVNDESVWIDVGSVRLPSMESLDLRSIGLKSSRCDGYHQFPRLQNFSVHGSLASEWVLRSAPDIARLSVGPGDPWGQDGVIWAYVGQIPDLHRLEYLAIDGYVWSHADFDKLASIIRALPNTLQTIRMRGFSNQTATLVQETLSNLSWVPNIAVLQLQTYCMDDDIDEDTAESVIWTLRRGEDGQRKLVQHREGK